MSNVSPKFWVGDIPIFGELILSPMDGYSDLPFRSLARSLGSVMSYTEFVNAIDVINGHPRLEQRLTYASEERPVVFQIFDNDPNRLVEAALRLREREPDIIDVNLGCSARGVAGRGAGAGLLRSPQKIEQIFSRLSTALDIPVTGKMRLGWDADSLNYLEVAKIIEENGGKLVAVHGRTKQQNYSGKADWDAIAEIKQAVSIPVIANGDVRTTVDIDSILAHTGCEAVMIGRAAIGNPWIFPRKERWQVTPEQMRATLSKHLAAMLEFYGDELGLILFRKHAARYISPFRLTRAQRKEFLNSPDAQAFLKSADVLILENELIPNIQ